MFFGSSMVLLPFLAFALDSTGMPPHRCGAENPKLAEVFSVSDDPVLPHAQAFVHTDSL